MVHLLSREIFLKNAVTFIIVCAHLNEYLICAHVIMSKTSRESVGVTLYCKHCFRFLLGL